jgi:lysophospholipase L1-like esterase
MPQRLFNKGWNRKLFFEGDSLSTLSEGNVALGRRMIKTAYTNLTGTRPAMFSTAVAGSEIRAAGTSSIIDRGSAITSVADPNDIIVVWAGTNDISVSGRTDAQVYADLVTYATLMRNAGLKVIAVTMIAKERAADADPTAINVTRLAYNALILGESSFVFDAYADPAALVQFNAVADASNATYYNADKVHLTDAGFDLVAGTVTTAIQSLL